MYSYSNDFHRLLGEDYRNFTLRLQMKVSDIDGNKVTLLLDNSDIMENSFSVDSATSNTGELTIGAVVSSQLKFTLYNNEDVFSLLDFMDGEVTLWVGMEVDGLVEEDLYGVYTVTEAKFSELSISITALDNVSKLSHTYEGGISYPATLEQIVRECCSACGVLYDTSLPTFMRNYIVKTAPQDTSLTYGMLISYVAQASGCFVRTTPDGKIRFDWYSMSTLNDNKDGGTFKYDGYTEDHEPEAQLDGGNFLDYSSGDDYDGGTFRDLSSYHTVNHTATSEFDTDDIAVTGVKVTSLPVDSSVEADTSLVGNEGYVIEINSNPLIQEGQSEVVAQQIYDNVRFMIFRPLSVTCLPDPSIEAGDIGIVADPSGNYYKCFFSTVTFIPDGYMRVACDAPSRNRQNSAIQSAITAVLQKSKEWVAHEKSDREIALENMTNLMSNALGFFTSEVVQEGGGSILYLHNKKRLEDSNIQWKVTEYGVMVSTDYGKTFNSGWTSDGNMVANTLSAIGVNADWINAGEITGRRINNGNGTFLVDESGNLYSSSAHITGGGIELTGQTEDDARAIIRRFDNENVYLSLSPGMIKVHGKDHREAFLGALQLVMEDLGNITTVTGHGITIRGDYGITINGQQVATMDKVPNSSDFATSNDVRTLANVVQSKASYSNVWDVLGLKLKNGKDVDIRIEGGIITNIKRYD